MLIDRRRALVLAASALAAPSIVGRAAAAAGGAVDEAVAGFAKLPGKTSCLLVAGDKEPLWRAAHDPGEKMFIASAFKTFVLAQFLREAEAGRLSEDTQYAIDDAVRTLGSAVFVNLSGTTTGRSVLEAMIAHSDNTAADIALAATGPDKVRALIAEAGLTETQIPDSTRLLTSYLVGAPEGVDIGWQGEQALAAGKTFGAPRPPLNDKQSMASTAEEMVRWYQLAFAGKFFAKPATLVEFKRIQGMADAIAEIVPADTVAYAKGGAIDLNGFHARCLAGQMLAGAAVPVTFCATINWTGPDKDIGPTFGAFVAVLSKTLQAARDAVQ